MNKRIAICISGILRCFEPCFKNLINNLVLNNINCDFDIFLYASTTTNTLDYIDGNTPPFRNINDDDKKIINNIFDVPNIKHKEYYFEEEISFDLNKYSNFIAKPSLNESNMGFPMFHKIYQCNEKKKTKEQTDNFIYDLVIRIRPDCLIKEAFNLDIIDTNFIYIAGYIGDFGQYCFNKHEYFSHYLADTFAISSSKNMNKYSDCWIYIDNYIIPDSFYRCHYFLYEHLKNEKIIQLEIDIPVLRLSGIVNENKNYL